MLTEIIAVSKTELSITYILVVFIILSLGLLEASKNQDKNN